MSREYLWCFLCSRLVPDGFEYLHVTLHENGDIALGLEPLPHSEYAGYIRRRLSVEDRERWVMLHGEI